MGHAMRRASRQNTVSTFSPLDLSPAAWYDASVSASITESGGAVSQWNDLSGNTRHVLQGTAGAKPTTGANIQNGLNVLTFDGGDGLVSGAVSIDSDLTYVSVFKVTTTTNYVMPGIMMGTSVGNTRPLDRWHSTGANPIFIQDAVVGTSGIDLRTGWGSFAVWTLTYSKTVSTQPRVVEYKNNVQQSSFNDTKVHQVANQLIGVGARPDLVTTLNGQIAEAMIFPSILGSTDLASIQTYLATKWGL